uniref:Nonsense-mediated mRNA decay factor SMG9 n=1 Tax=Chelonoidis abingdonii TaxID=106734 RepID=A0A8C0IK22_CHEAB
MWNSGHSSPGLYGPDRRARPSGPGRERDYGPWDRERREPTEEPVGSVMQKTPIILAKPPAERSKLAPAPAPAPPATAPPPMEKPIVLMKSREEGKGPAGVSEGAAQLPTAAAKGEKEGQRPTQPVYQIQNRGMGSTASSSTMDPVVGQAKLLAPEKMKHSIKLVDDQMNWCDSAIEYLLDQTDVLVVGVLGLQGTGKSMLMSLLSANQPEEDQRAYVFRTQSQEIKERGGNQTSGIDFFITQERIIFLDTQPILSPSILDHLINNDRKLPPEYNLPHTYVEMQSLQIAAFLFTVCHVVIVVQDWFTDLRTAEMAETSTPPQPSPPGSSGTDEARSIIPCSVTLPAGGEPPPRPCSTAPPSTTLGPAGTCLCLSGTLSMLECNIFPGLPYDYLDTEVNLFLLPFADSDTDDTFPRAAPGGGPLFSLLPGYKGHPSFQSLMAKLRSQIMSMARPQLSHTILTEKNWFHYAARIWDGVKKSSALSEYSRLLA